MSSCKFLVVVVEQLEPSSFTSQVANGGEKVYRRNDAGREADEHRQVRAVTFSSDL
jgi:hypothetical protein